MNKCKISWGKVIKIYKHSLLVQTRPLIFNQGQLDWGPIKPQKIITAINGKSLTKNKINMGDLITFHWDCFCEQITLLDAQYLDKYTQQAIFLANT
jgi:hypothetical protein